MNWFSNMPIEFQIGSIVAIAFFALSLLLTLCKRGILMHITMLISLLSCLFCCLLAGFGWNCVKVVIVYCVVWWFLINQYIKAMVKAQLEAEMKLYSSDFEYVPADPFEFTWLDLDYYDTTQRELESLGFKKVGDYELLPQTRAFPETRTFSRKFINEEQDIEAAITNTRAVKPKNAFERSINYRFVEFLSEFSDGTFFETNNARGINPITEVGGIKILMFEPTISIEKLLEAHEESIETICETKKVDIVVFRNASEQLAAAEREFLLFRKDRQKKCGLTVSETTRLASYFDGKIGEEGIKTLMSEYNKQARKRRKKQEDKFPQS